MQSELQFFMTETDQSDFFTFVRDLVDDISDNQRILQIGDCVMEFTPSQRENDILYTGKLSINTMDKTGAACDNEERAKNVFRKIKKWIKKHYWSRLAYLNKHKKNKLTPSRAYWLGPDAKKWKDENPDQHILKLSTTSWMVFEIGI